VDLRGHQLTLRQHYALLVFFMTAVAVGYVLWSDARSENQLFSDARHESELLASATAAEITADIDAAVTAFAAAAADPDVDTVLCWTPRIAVAQRTHRAVFTDGVKVCETEPEFAGAEQLARRVRQQGAVIVDADIGPDDDYVLAAAAPMASDPGSVIVSAVPVAHIAYILSAAAASTPGAKIVATGPSGVLASSSTSSSAVADTGQAEDAEQRLVASVGEAAGFVTFVEPLDIDGWQVVAGIDETVISDTRWARLRDDLIGVALVVLTAWAGLLLLNRFINRPVEQLVDALDAAAAGELVRASTAGPAELAKLAEHVNSFLDARDDVEQALADARERERARIARVLHDDPVQALVAVKYLLGQVHVDPADQALLADVVDNLDLTADTLRTLAIDIYPAEFGSDALETGEFGVALQTCAEDLCGRVGMTVDVDGSVGSDVPPKVMRLAYRNVREALRNVCRHAGAGSVTIRFASCAEGFEVSVSDDGVGMSRVDREGETLGLTLMRDSTRLAGGTFDVESARGDGTTVRFRYPLGPRTGTIADTARA
jgi:signal transduction histidine kinase